MQVKISVTTQRSHQNMAHKSHLYVFDKDITNEILKSLRHDYVGYTTNQKQIRCKARIHADIITGEIVHSFGMYLHAENSVRIEMATATKRTTHRANISDSGISFYFGLKIFRPQSRENFLQYYVS